jgi:glycosyltransferase involved in cell wall biosynthesis
MHICVDARDLNRETPRGQGKYLFEILSQKSLCDVKFQLLSDRRDLPVHLPERPNVSHQFLDQRGHRFHAWEQFALPKMSTKSKCDLTFCPSMRLPWWQPKPTVVTLHDAMPWIGNENCWPRGFYTDTLIPKALDKCAAIITVSNHSRSDIATVWPHLESKIHVIPNGVSEIYKKSSTKDFPKELSDLGVNPPYFLYLGGSISRKRPEWAIRVFENLGHLRSQLVLCGIGASEGANFVSAVPKQTRKQILFPPHIPERWMPSLYEHATAILYPTLYEGFGLPVVEAHAVGTPVIFSSVGSLIEFDGPLSSILPSDDLECWVKTCNSFLDAQVSKGIQEEGLKWVSRYSWQRSADSHFDVFNSVVNGV